jgi:hypothetical protein
MPLLDEAAKCRLDALAFADGPEAPFLLRIARAFEELAELNQTVPKAPGGLPNGALPASSNEPRALR